MNAVTIPRTLAAGVVIAAIAAVLVIGGRPTSDALLPSSELVDPTPAPLPTAERPTAATPVVAGETPAAAKQRELNAMSETYRNTTFLIAIRDAGFVCNELLRVIGGLDDSPKWLASCSEMHSYTVGVTSDGRLDIGPMLLYFDGATPAIQRDFESAPQPLRPQTLPPTR